MLSEIVEGVEVKNRQGGLNPCCNGICSLRVNKTFLLLMGVVTPCFLFYLQSA